MSKFILFISLFALLTINPKLYADSANDFHRIKRLIQKAERFEKDGKADQARKLFSTALEKLQEIRQTDPNWEPEPVQELIQHCTEHMGAATSGTLPSPESKSEIPAKAEPLPPSSAKQKEARGSEPNVDQLKSQLKNLQKELQSLQASHDAFKAKANALQTQLDSAIKENESLKQELAASQTNLQQHQAYAKENKSLKSQLAKAHVQLEIVQKERETMRDGYERTKLTVEAANLDRLQRLSRENESLKEKLSRAIP